MSEKNEWRDQIMEIITGVWDREIQIDHATDEIMELLSPTSSAPGDAQDERQAYTGELQFSAFGIPFIVPSSDADAKQIAEWGKGARVYLTQTKPASAAGDAHRPDFARAEQIAADFVQDYEWRGEDVAGRDTCYTPNKRERAMITDAILGLLAEPEFIAALAAQVPQQGEA